MDVHRGCDHHILAPMYKAKANQAYVLSYGGLTMCLFNGNQTEVNGIADSILYLSHEPAAER